MKSSKPYTAWNLTDWRDYFRSLEYSADQSRRAARKALSQAARRIALADGAAERGAQS